MGRFEIPDHPEIESIERTGYPSWLQEEEEEDLLDEDYYESEFWGDEREDDLYEEARETEWSDLFY